MMANFFIFQLRIEASINIVCDCIIVHDLTQFTISLFFWLVKSAFFLIFTCLLTPSINCHILRAHMLCLALCTDGFIVACVDVLQLTHGAVATVSDCVF